MVALVLLVGAADVVEDRADAPAPVVLKSSLHALVDGTAGALESRASGEGATGPISVSVTVGRGINAVQVDRAFTARLRQRLKTRGILTPSTTAALRARLLISVEGTRVWIVGELEGGSLPGPSSFAISRPLDRELEVLMGKPKESARTRWLLERLGPLTAGAIDLTLTDVDGDLVDDIVVLSVDGVRAYRYAPGDPRPVELGRRRALPEGRWPRTIAGWIAKDANGRVYAATSRGDLTLHDIPASTSTNVAQRGVPLRMFDGDKGGGRVVFTGGGIATPLLEAPVRNQAGRLVEVGKLPLRVRDLTTIPGKRDGFIYVDNDGFVGARIGDGEPMVLAPEERVGDRIIVIDLDGDGDLELVTTGPTGPGETDYLTISRIDRDFSSMEIMFRAPLSGGEIVAIGVGDLDLDDRPDVILIEETGDPEAMLWRLEHAP